MIFTGLSTVVFSVYDILMYENIASTHKNTSFDFIP